MKPTSAKTAYSAAHPWPLLRIRRSRSCQAGRFGSTLRTQAYRTASSSTVDSEVPTWALCARWVIITTCRRMRADRSRHCSFSVSVRSMASWLALVLLDLREGDVRIPLEPCQPESVQSDSFQESKRLPGPQWVVELIEGDHSALGHPWHERLDGSLRGLVEVAVQKQQADDEVSVVAHVVKHGFHYLDAVHLDLRLGTMLATSIH